LDRKGRKGKGGGLKQVNLGGTAYVSGRGLTVAAGVKLQRSKKRLFYIEENGGGITGEQRGSIKYEVDGSRD